MNQDMGIIFQSEQVRAWVDERNIGHIRIIRRVNFSTLITIISRLVEQVMNNSLQERKIIIYIPVSLRGICSENLRSFIEFTRTCCGMDIMVIESDEGGTHLI